MSKEVTKKASPYAPPNSYYSECTRLCSVSDNTFAGTLLLLVISLAISSHADMMSHKAMLAVLKKFLPHLLTYFLCFYIVSREWLAHNLLYTHVQSISARIAASNFFYLCSITLVPFEVALLSMYRSNIVVIIFCVGITIPSIFMLIMTHLVQGDPVTSTRNIKPAKGTNTGFVQYLPYMSISIGFLSALLAFWLNTNALWVWVIVVFGVPFARFIARISSEHSDS